MMQWALIRWLAGVPRLFDALRWTLEGGYRGHHRVIQRHLQNAGRVLDVGCGTGIYARFFEPSAYVGVDINPDYIAAARARSPAHQFLIQDATADSIQAGEFDACMISGVLHHLDDAEAWRLLTLAARHVHPDGIVVVWEDIPASWWNVVGHIIHRLDLGRHIRRADGYRQLLENHFTVRDSYHMRSGAMDYQVFVATVPGMSSSA